MNNALTFFCRLWSFEAGRLTNKKSGHGKLLPHHVDKIAVLTFIV